MSDGSPFASGRQDPWRSKEISDEPPIDSNEDPAPLELSVSAEANDSTKLPVEDLTRFVKLVEAAKSCGFNALDVDLTSNGLSVRLSG